jgi:hypothetical protein
MALLPLNLSCPWRGVPERGRPTGTQSFKVWEDWGFISEKLTLDARSECEHNDGQGSNHALALWGMFDLRLIWGRFPCVGIRMCAGFSEPLVGAKDAVMT